MQTNDEAPADETAEGESQTAPETATGAEAGGKPRHAKRERRHIHYAAYVAAGVVAMGITLGAFAALGGGVSADGKIPSPPAKNSAFVVDDDGVGQDNVNDVAAATAPGVVRVQSASGPVGSGMVITRSGLVLAADHGLDKGVTGLSAVSALSGHVYGAKVVGTDPVAGLALLQLSGAGSYKTVNIGNAEDAKTGDTVGSVGAGPGKGVMFSSGNVLGENVTAKIDGQRLTGLIEVDSLGESAQMEGGPLVALNGQVLGMNLAAVVGKHDGTGYVVPVNGALEVAKEIAGQS